VAAGSKQGEITFGVSVKLMDELTGKEQTLRILGVDEEASG
jgi:hypothetical protein